MHDAHLGKLGGESALRGNPGGLVLNLLVLVGPLHTLQVLLHLLLRLLDDLGSIPLCCPQLGLQVLSGILNALEGGTVDF